MGGRSSTIIKNVCHTKMLYEQQLESISKTMNNINVDPKWYEIPSGITGEEINAITGNSDKNGVLCFYEKGTEPSYNYIDMYEKLSK